MENEATHGVELCRLCKDAPRRLCATCCHNIRMVAELRQSLNGRATEAEQTKQALLHVLKAFQLFTKQQVDDDE